MQTNNLATAILTDQWLMPEDQTNAYFFMVSQILLGEKKEPTTEIPDPKCFYHGEQFQLVSKWDISEAESNSILSLNINGPILKDGDYWTYGTDRYVAWLEQASSNENILGAFIEIHSAGGQSIAVPGLQDAIKNFGKPVVTLVNGVCASGAAYGIIYSSKIYASHTLNYFGSLGAFHSFKDFSKYYEKMGIKLVSVYAPSSTEKNLESRAAQEGNMEPLEEWLDQIAIVLNDSVKDARAGMLKEVEGITWEKGRTFTADIATQLGLIDGIKTKKQALQELVLLISNNNQSVDMFGDKHKKLSALAGVETASVTDEQVNDVNAQLTELNITGVRVVRTDWVDEAEASITKAATAEKNLQAMTSERDSWKVKAETYGKQPGATPTALTKTTETVEDPKETVIISQTDMDFWKTQGKTFVVAD